LDPDRKIFISKGGKKRYYLTNAFIDTITCDTNQKDTLNNLYFQEAMKVLSELLSNKALGLKTRYALMNVLMLMNNII
jgi:5-methylcytosine-specific restriction endonuclease McrA